jgi:hypothetical protein
MDISRSMEADPSKSRKFPSLSGSGPMAADIVGDVSPFSSARKPDAGAWSPSEWGVHSIYAEPGPWFPRGIVDPSRSDDHRNRSRPSLVGNRGAAPPHYHGFRTTSALPSECDTHDPRGPLPSDSGYGTKYSESTSLYGDVDRSQDTQSLAGQLEYMHPFGLPGDTFSRDDNIPRDHWPNAPQSQVLGTQNGGDGNKLICPTCKKSVKTRSELKYVLYFLGLATMTGFLTIYVASTTSDTKNLTFARSLAVLEPTASAPSTIWIDTSAAFTPIYSVCRAVVTSAILPRVRLRRRSGHALTISVLI